MITSGVKKVHEAKPIDRTAFTVTCLLFPLSYAVSEEQINELFASCLPRLRKASRKMLANQQDCNDALQDGLLLAFRKLHQFDFLHSQIIFGPRLENTGILRSRRSAFPPRHAGQSASTLLRIP